MSSTTTQSLSFRPWAQDAAANSNSTADLKDVLQRVTFERGHFRDITEASLQEEIAAEGGLELSDSEADADEDDKHDKPSDDDAGEDDQQRAAASAAAQPSTREELYKAKMDMLQHVAAAEQDVLMALDFVSLLESTYEPGRAGATMSPVLRAAVPAGSLGADVLHRGGGGGGTATSRAPPREALDALVATNVRLAGLQRSADSLLAAATRLRANVRCEARYWDLVLSVSDRGWNVLRLPRQPHLLGVHFGFGSGGGEAAKRDVAALLPGADGSVGLERGLGSRPKALRAVLRRGGRVVGRSALPALRSDDETTLEARIRSARDSVFDEELYHEMIREGRLLAAAGVTTRGAAITFPVLARRGEDDEALVSLELVDVNDHSSLGADVAGGEDDLARAIVLAARLFLSQAHRERSRLKTQLPPPMREKKDDQLVLRVLRPLISVMRHFSALAHLNSYLDGVVASLQQAQIEASCVRGTVAMTLGANVSSLEDVIRVFMGTMSTTASIAINLPKDGPFELKLGLETSPAAIFGSAFSLGLPSQRTHRYINVEDLVAGVDGYVASALAKALCSAMGSEWRCDERAALVRRAADDGDDGLPFKIVVDSAARTLILRSGNRNTAWGPEDSSKESFWTAWKKQAT